MTTIHKFKSVGNWEVLYIDGESVAQNHHGRIDVLDHLEEGMEIETVVSCRVNLPDDDDYVPNRYPSTLDEVVEDDRFDYDGGVMPA